MTFSEALLLCVSLFAHVLAAGCFSVAGDPNKGHLRGAMVWGFWLFTVVGIFVARISGAAP